MRSTKAFAILALAVILGAEQRLPTASTALGSLTVKSAKVYYADGSVAGVASPGMFDAWKSAAITGVQVVKVYFIETYRAWHATAETHTGETTCDANTFYPNRNGNRPGHCAVLNYAHMFHGAREPADVYWWDGNSDWGAGLVIDVPLTLPPLGSKTGTLIADADFLMIYNAAKEDHVAP